MLWRRHVRKNTENLNMFKTIMLKISENIFDFFYYNLPQGELKNFKSWYIIYWYTGGGQYRQKIFGKKIRRYWALSAIQISGTNIHFFVQKMKNA
jgi:hypothetical protein